MRILSLFDGISVAQQALKELGYTFTYYASEVDKYAIQITQKNHPETIQLGDVTKVTKEIVGNVDILVGGFPCQSHSIAGKRKGFDDPRGQLFFECTRLLRELRPKYFLFENVHSMSTEAKRIITKDLLNVYEDTNYIMIDAALVSAQSRKRIFWTNIPGVGQPRDRGIMLKDVLEPEVEDKYNISTQHTQAMINARSGINDKRNWDTIRIGEIGNGGQSSRVYSPGGKSVTLSALGGGEGAKTGLYLDNEVIRKLTPVECERLQSLPDNYTEGISNTQRYKCLGNAFNCEVIKHIFSYMEKAI